MLTISASWNLEALYGKGVPKLLATRGYESALLGKFHIALQGNNRAGDAIARDPAEADWWIEQERRTGRQFLKNTSFRELRDSALVPIERLTGRELAIASNTDDARPCACTD